MPVLALACDRGQSERPPETPGWRGALAPSPSPLAKRRFYACVQVPSSRRAGPETRKLVLEGSTKPTVWASLGGQHLLLRGTRGRLRVVRLAVRARAQPYPLLSRLRKSYIFMGFGGATLFAICVFIRPHRCLLWLLVPGIHKSRPLDRRSDERACVSPVWLKDAQKVCKVQ